MKKCILFLLISLFLFPAKVYAYESVPNDCVDNQTCLLVCNYENDFSGIMRSMSIFYYFDGRWEVSYWNQIEDSYEGTKGPNDFGKIFSSSGSPNVYWLTGVDSTNFKCPEHGYFDRNAVTELCFADTQEACEAKSGWTLTLFGSRDSDFKSDEKDYDFEEQIANYHNWIIQDIAEDITKGKISTDDIPEKVKKDVQTNFLYGNMVPTFIENSEAYKSIEQATKEEYEKYKKQEQQKAEKALKEAEKATSDAEEKYNNGEISEEEYEEVKNKEQEAQKELETVNNNWSATGNEVASDVGEVLKEITYSSGGSIIKDWSGDTCDSLLGSKNDKNDPYYYLYFAFRLIKYIAIVLLFVFSVIEYFKAVASNDNEALKKATKQTVKRLIICVIIFLLPILIDFVFNLLGIVDNPTCGIGG